MWFYLVNIPVNIIELCFGKSLSYLKTVLFFQILLFLFIETKAVFSIGLILLYYWGKTFVVRYLIVHELWCFLLSLVRAGHSPSSVWSLGIIPCKSFQEKLSFALGSFISWSVLNCRLKAICRSSELSLCVGHCHPIFCPVNSSCLGHLRLPAASSQLRKPARLWLGSASPHDSLEVLSRQ